MKRVWRYTSQSLARRSLLFGMKLNREDTACRFLLPCTLSRAIRFMLKQGTIFAMNKSYWCRELLVRCQKVMVFHLSQPPRVRVADDA